MDYDFSCLSSYIDSLRKDKKLPGGDVIVYFKGKQLYRYTVGNVNEDSIYYLYSCTKPVTVTAGMQLVERGLLNLDDPVSKYIPEFGKAVYRKDNDLLPAGDKLKIRHLFTMSAGLNYNLETEAIKNIKCSNPNASTLDIIPAFIENNPLEFEPGTKFKYSLCHDVLAGVIEVASGKKYSDWLQNEIFDPLEMYSATFHVDKNKEHLVAKQYRADEGEIIQIPIGISQFAVTPNYESGGAGLACTADDYGKFAAAMSCGGISSKGVRILKSETVDLLRAPQLTENNGFGCAAGPGYSYAFGVRTLYSNEFGAKSRIGEFGWDGAAGSFILMDPASEVAIVYTQQVLYWPLYFGCMHAPIRDLTYKALGL